ncbi:MAG: GGDEF domain-containing protein [Burkholderiales bacterium]|nr:GGDEF domain-containing protein [Burkholderiales bacterium]
MFTALARTLSPLAAPAAVLLAARLLLPLAAALPAGIGIWAPWVVLAGGGALAVAFGRGRVFFALATLALAYLGGRNWFAVAPDTWPAHAVLISISLFVPFNLALFALVRERGIFNRHGGNKSLLIALEVIVTAWIGLEHRAAPLELVAQPFLPRWLVPATPIPDAGLALLAVGFAAVLAKALIRHSPIDAAVAGALYAFAVAADASARPDTFGLYLLAGAFMLALGTLQDSYRMAFRDELTSLPSRRALNERLLGLGRRYAIAMLDVDHFKKFNDAHGHEVGDQVLRMVAAKLREVGGGGRAYRYGGEEFTVVFARSDIDDALPHLEALRQAVEGYRMALRGADRPQRKKAGKRRRSRNGKTRSVSVTVSVGVAQRTERLDTPDKVLRAADKALYRAKRAGRNQVARWP